MKKQVNTTNIIQLTDYDGLKNDISQTIYSNLHKYRNLNPNNNYNTFENKITGAVTKHTTMKKSN